MLTVLVRVLLARGTARLDRFTGWLPWSRAFIPFLVGLALAPRAHATGPVELLAQLSVDPARPEHLVALYSNTGTRRGLLFSDDAGASWKLLCADGILAQALADGPTRSSEDVAGLRSELRRMEPVALAAGGSTLVGTAQGLFRGDGKGCGFVEEPLFVGRRITSLLSHPKQPEIAFAMLGFEGDRQGIWKRAADGTWSRFGAVEPPPAQGDRVVLKSMSLAVNAQDVRVYQVVWRYSEATKKAQSVLRVSDDGALSWREEPLDDELDEFTVLATDPTHSERVLGVVRRSDNGHGNWSIERDSVMLSDDGGRNFRSYFEVAELSAALFRRDGSLWLSDSGAQVDGEQRAGLFRAAPGLGAPPEPLSAAAHQCLSNGPADDTLYACQSIRLGKLDPVRGTLETLVQTSSVGGFVSCPGRNIAADCRDQMCQSGYCIQGHFPEAPVCEAYDEPFCGPRAVWHPPVDAQVDASGAEAPDTEVRANPPRHVTDPAFDSYDAGVIVIDGPPPEERKVHVGCSVTQAPRAGGWALAVLLSVLAARRARWRPARRGIRSH
jgi:hypothetical protein